MMIAGGWMRRMPNADCRMPNAECRLPNAQCRLPNAECRMSDAECWMSDAECRISDAECRTSNVELVPIPLNTHSIIYKDFNGGFNAAVLNLNNLNKQLSSIYLNIKLYYLKRTKLFHSIFQQNKHLHYLIKKMSERFRNFHFPSQFVVSTPSFCFSQIKLAKLSCYHKTAKYSAFYGLHFKM